MCNQCYQLAGGSVKSLARYLHDMAAKCVYGAMHDEIIRARLVMDISDKAQSQELQLSVGLTLAAAYRKPAKRSGSSPSLLYSIRLRQFYKYASDRFQMLCSSQPRQL